MCPIYCKFASYDLMTPKKNIIFTSKLLVWLNSWLGTGNKKKECYHDERKKTTPTTTNTITTKNMHISVFVGPVLFSFLLESYVLDIILMQVIFRRRTEEFHTELGLGFGFWCLCVCVLIRNSPFMFTNLDEKHF